MEHHADFESWIAATERWNPEAERLRAVLLGTELTESIKWGKPCYGHEGENICLMQPFSGFLALLFFKGILLSAPDGVLQEQGQNTHAARRVCFTTVAQVEELADTVRDLVEQAIRHEQRGTPLPEKPEPEWAPELLERLRADPALKRAFDALTPGRQRAYNLHFSGAKRSGTRAARVDKAVPRILAGKGLRDRG